MTSKSSGQRRTITWNEENRVKSIADQGSTEVFLYDDSGERAVKRGQYGESVYVSRFYSLKNGGLGSKHVFAGETRVVTKLEKDGGSIQTGVPGSIALINSQGIYNAYDRGGGTKRGIERRLNPDGSGSGTTNPPIEKFEFFYHPDHLGSSSFITDDAGATYQHLEYFPYGDTWVDEGGTGQMPMYRFTGKELDPETGLYYYGARYYDPVLSRWISADPIDRFNAQSPPTALSLYQYSLLNPIRLIDPTGLSEEESQSLWSKLGDWYETQKENIKAWVGEQVRENVEIISPEVRERRKAAFETAGGDSADLSELEREGAGKKFGEVAEWTTGKGIEVAEVAATTKVTGKLLSAGAQRLKGVGKLYHSIKEGIGIYPKKIGAGGVPQPFSRLTGRYVSPNQTLGGKVQNIAARVRSGAPGQFTEGFSQGFAAGAYNIDLLPAYSKANEWGQIGGQFIGNIWGSFN